VNDAREAKAAAMRPRMAELAQRFVARTREELIGVRQSLARIDAGDPGGCAPIRHFAHRVCGTAGTLGFAALSDIAANLERMLDQRGSDAIPDASIPVRVLHAIEAIDAQLSQLDRPD
jgi:HPt (histidine-containing phosphotransfer) domain-containing protein